MNLFFFLYFALALHIFVFIMFYYWCCYILDVKIQIISFLVTFWPEAVKLWRVWMSPDNFTYWSTLFTVLICLVSFIQGLQIKIKLNCVLIRYSHLSAPWATSSDCCDRNVWLLYSCKAKSTASAKEQINGSSSADASPRAVRSIGLQPLTESAPPPPAPRPPLY